MISAEEMTSDSALAAVASALGQASSVALACHQNPDGDALGSLLGLGLALEQLGKDVVCLSTDGVPAAYSFLPGAGRIVRTTERRDFSVTVGLDSGDLARTGSSAATLLAAPTLIDIDHHATSAPFGQLRFIDPTCASTAQLVLQLLAPLGVQLTPDIAQNLLAGVLTDTGGFRYPNTDARSLADAARLVDAGARPTPIAESVYERKSLNAQKLLGRALESLTLFHDGAVAAAWVTQADFSHFGAADADTDGIVSSVLAVEGVKIALFLREMTSGTLRVSLRARDGGDVATIAARFGGGGHRLAAGCSLPGPPERAVAELVAAFNPASGA